MLVLHAQSCNVRSQPYQQRSYSTQCCRLRQRASAQLCLGCVRGRCLTCTLLQQGCASAVLDQVSTGGLRQQQQHQQHTLSVEKSSPGGMTNSCGIAWPRMERRRSALATFSR